ncbi:unnamed protein product [Acanthoscelides obtectus]|uniref:FLYWCH-type domain-containing protein n=1 Tax=Acanthoscelides obtectus TaxID=200917 RepID=A0A9P0PIA5_ACAOB|nr:unnamed protein product [Acanthoscelides obtectus]CAK1676613.1 hypothetical protein AOBTE_LOCUS30855 [Acanthoscelides obtectus]
MHNLLRRSDEKPEDSTRRPRLFDIEKRNQQTVWKCCYYFRTREKRCKSTLVTTGRIVTVSSDTHNHPAVPKKDKYKNMLSQKVTIIRE